jgi:hypothetical protein
VFVLIAAMDMVGEVVIHALSTTAKIVVSNGMIVNVMMMTMID